MQIRLFGHPEVFEWDADKADLNLQKHHLAFEDAVRVFNEPTYDSMTLRRGELRVISIGTLEGLEVTLVYVVRGTTFRIISARRASKDEREAYRSVFARPGSAGADGLGAPAGDDRRRGGTRRW